ncbi:MAG TPA: bifunctional DNA-binding transcriptional regulator/O6-methylguanine-DNA methyltransferase Ada [Fimbriimonas sp.]|nr:bifunctional DNA-binding transcriptional regulator/O6-methylguanine-DNA methyltransferase Ada [Fimbriimonas sp.]
MKTIEQPLTEDQMWEAVCNSDRAFDGRFVLGVTSTHIYCRPSCPARKPLRKNVQFYNTPEEAEAAGFRACLRCDPKAALAPKAALVKDVCDYVEAHLDEPVTLQTLSDWTGVSPFHLQRVFKEISGISPREYQDACRLRAFKDRVRSGESVSRAQTEAGFSSGSRLYEKSSSQLGMTPATYGKKGKGALIRYGLSDSPVGKILVAATARGVCFVEIGDDESVLIASLDEEFSQARLERSDEAVAGYMEAVVKLAEGEPTSPLSIDVQGTIFQRKVWEALRRIPKGEVRSYAEVAAEIGEPKAVRAVALACKANPVALVTPCHRVIRNDQSLSGYRWGAERKAILLENEKS